MARQIAAWIYGLQVFLVLPWFLGAIYRDEQSLWVWDMFSVSLHRHGLWDAIFLSYLYAIFYSAFFVIPFYLLWSWTGSSRTRGAIAFLAAWFAASVLLFADSTWNLCVTSLQAVLVVCLSYYGLFSASSLITNSADWCDLPVTTRVFNGALPTPNPAVNRTLRDKAAQRRLLLRYAVRGRAMDLYLNVLG